jgi:hypothetical protein
VKKYSGRGNPPNQTLVNAFIISRVPITNSISYGTLNINLLKDIELAREKGFDFLKYSRRATSECMLRFIIERRLLSHSVSVNSGDGRVTRNDRSEAYMRRLPKRVISMIDKLPTTDLLVLLAGSAE